MHQSDTEPNIMTSSNKENRSMSQNSHTSINSQRLEKKTNSHVSFDESGAKKTKTAENTENFSSSVLQTVFALVSDSVFLYEIKLFFFEWLAKYSAKYSIS